MSYERGYVKALNDIRQKQVKFAVTIDIALNNVYQMIDVDFFDTELTLRALALKFDEDYVEDRKA